MISKQSGIVVKYNRKIVDYTRISEWNISMIKRDEYLKKLNDSVNGQINDLVNDPVNLTAGYYYANDLSDFDLLLLKTIHENPGFRVPGLLKLMESKDGSATSDRIKNSIRRKLKDYVEYMGATKNGGYYLKDY